MSECIDTGFWAAIAASAAALATFLLWRTERRVFLHTVMPELVLSGWERFTPEDGDGSVEGIRFTAVENVGPGSALHVHIGTFSKADDDRPMTVMGSIREALIAPNKKVNTTGSVVIYWNHVPGQQGNKILRLTIKIYAWDRAGVNHLTEYVLTVFQSTQSAGMHNEITSGVVLNARPISSHPEWRLKLRRRMGQDVF